MCLTRYVRFCPSVSTDNHSVLAHFAELLDLCDVWHLLRDF